MKKIQYFQDFIYSLCEYWTKQGCIWSQPYDMPMGAGTFHPHTFFKALGRKPWQSVYVQPCRRPVDGRYGKSPNRLQYYYQLQVLIKPAPANILDIYLKSLEHVGIVLKQNDVALYEDNWKGPTLGAWGLGWEVRANGEEITQFTYFQEFAGLSMDVTPCEITYGLERIFMYANGYKNIMEIPYNKHFTYGDIFYQNELEFSQFNFKCADTKMLFQQFEMCEQKVLELCENKLALPAYDYVLQASHSFNLLDARGALSVTERQRFLGKVRNCAKQCALAYIENKSFDTETQTVFNLAHNLTSKSDSKTKYVQYKTKNNTPTKGVDVLLEIGVEEMPPDFQISAAASLEQKILNGKNKFFAQYAYDQEFVKLLNAMQLKIMISARRIALICENVPTHTPAQVLELWGPAARIAKDAHDNLTQAGIGFCKKNQLEQNQISFKQKGDTSFLYAQRKIEPFYFPQILVDEFKNYIYALDIPLKMKWLPDEISPPFIRPVRWLVCLVNNKILPIEMFGLKSSAQTYGQRVLKPKSIVISKASEYEATLKKACVIPSAQKRKASIVQQMSQLIKTLGSFAKVVDDPTFLDKCVGMSESPFVFCGKFDDKYLKLPQKLIVSVLKEHMNYFHVISNTTHTILPYYIGVANYKCSNVKSMIEGTQKVVTSRLEDGAFYFDTDLKTPFQGLREKLKSQVFQEGLGTLFDKSERLALYSHYLANLINTKTPHFFSNEDIDCLVEASRHCKNDLKTGCVQEFPDEMQGVMGGVLIRAQNTFYSQEKSAHIARAIEEHYFPLNAQSALPSTKWSTMLALADKMDSLILLLSAGYEPKGHNDPFGLRRLAISIVRLLIGGDTKTVHSNEAGTTLPISIMCSFEELLNEWKTHCATQTAWNPAHIKTFFTDRVKNVLKETFNPNSIESVSHLLTQKPLNIFVPLLTALEKHFTNPESLIPYKRARSMTLDVKTGVVNPSLFSAEAEHQLYNLCIETHKNTEELFNKGNFERFFEQISLIAQPLAHFFDSVLVNDPNLNVRQNRLQLLLKVRHLYEKIVDLSVIQVTSPNA